MVISCQNCGHEWSERDDTNARHLGFRKRDGVLTRCPACPPRAAEARARLNAIREQAEGLVHEIDQFDNFMNDFDII